MQVSSSASAQALEQMKQRREKMFSRADQDGSGGLSLDEFKSMAPGRSSSSSASSAGSTAETDRSAAIFAKLDADGDGSVTSAELEAGRPQGQPPGRTFSSDTMSALLSRQEASGTSSGSGTSSSDVFASLDTDGDGSLSATEFAAGSKAQGARGAGGPGGPGGPPPGGPPPGGPPPGGPPPGEKDDGTSLSSLLSSATDASDGTDGTSRADSLAALVRKALESYLTAGTTQSASSTLVSA